MDQSTILKDYFSPEDIASMTNMFNFMSNLKGGQKWDDYTFIPAFSADGAKYCYEEWNPRKGDVLLVSYPKTGTFWTAEVIKNIVYQDEKMRRLSEALPTPLTLFETSEAKERFKLLEKCPLQTYCMGSHLPAPLVNIEKFKKAGAKIVYVYRNPKDQIVSWYNFARKLPMVDVEPYKSMLTEGWDKFVDHVIAGDFPMTSKPGEWYPEHILSWYPHRDNKTVYFVCFEDMKKDVCREIKCLAEFLEHPVTDERVKEIAEACSFDTMKKNKTKGDTTDAKLVGINMRKGGVGGWKDHFTVNQSERVDAIFEEKLKDTDIKFTYEL